jgi:hypothetical protein
MSIRDAAARTWYRVFAWFIRISQYLGCVF